MNSVQPAGLPALATIFYGEEEIEIAKGDTHIRLSRQEFGQMIKKGMQVGYFSSPQYTAPPACQRGSFFDMKA